eukprot:3195174-Prymnesium_polylepis.1
MVIVEKKACTTCNQAVGQPGTHAINASNRARNQASSNQALKHSITQSGKQASKQASKQTSDQASNGAAIHLGAQRAQLGEQLHPDLLHQQQEHALQRRVVQERGGGGDPSMGRHQQLACRLCAHQREAVSSNQ